MQIDGVRPPPLEVLQSNAAALAAATSAATIAGTTGTTVGTVRPVALQPRPVGQQMVGDRLKSIFIIFSVRHSKPQIFG